jgi:act minimal PKS ketosynthase (KS/KS alpha)
MSGIAITGIGTVAPGEPGVKPFWHLLTSGRTATRRITRFDPSSLRSQLAAECDVDFEREGLTATELGRMDRASRLAVVALREAVRDSGIDVTETDPVRTGVSIGNAVGATVGLEEQYVALSDHGRDWLMQAAQAPPQLYGYMVPSTIAVEAAWAAGAQGPVGLVSTGCTSGLDAVGHAMRLLTIGAADVMIAGATDAPISPITMACFDAIKATSPDNDHPESASRPFDRDRRGFVMGEGSAVFVLERTDHAQARGARIYAELIGYASRSNAYHMTGLKPDGREMAEAITMAMNQAEVAPVDIGYINAHGSGTKQNDRHETAAFKRALGHCAYDVPASSIKSMIGHSLGAIGSLELAACALTIENGVIPPTANLENADPECDLDYVPLTAREQDVDVVLSVGSGFGGFQSAVLMSAPGWAR